MKKKIKPKSKNKNIGFHFYVSVEAIQHHISLSTKQKLLWLENANKFLHITQTEKEKQISRTIQRHKNV